MLQDLDTFSVYSQGVRQPGVRIAEFYAVRMQRVRVAVLFSGIRHVGIRLMLLTQSSV